jgi:Uma2 family endonuclease
VNLRLGHSAAAGSLECVGAYDYADFMSAVPRLDLLTVDEYLKAEVLSPVKHEYLGGVVYAMAGGRNLHNVIAGNVFAFLHARLRGNRCRPYNSDTKIRVRLPTHVRFYYPDSSVIGRPNPHYESFQDEPVVIAEVLSRKTRRIDEGEKRDAYLAIQSLSVYLLVEQELPAVVVHRRTERGFVRETYQNMDAVIPLPEIGTELPLGNLRRRGLRARAGHQRRFVGLLLRTGNRQ